MQLLTELSAILISAIIFVGFCAFATYVFQSVFHYGNHKEPNLKLHKEDDYDYLDEEHHVIPSFEKPLQHPSNFTDFR